MDVKHITSHTIRNLLNLTSKKDELIKTLEEVETEIAKTLTGVVSAATDLVEAVTTDKPKAKPARKIKRTRKKKKS